MYSLCHSERPFVILSASEESVSSPPIFSSSPFTRHLRRQSPFQAVFSTFPAHISTPKPTCAMANLDTRPEWQPLCAHVLSLSFRAPFCHSERQRRICCFFQISFFRSFYPTCVQATIDIRFVWHPVCALLRISPDICADNPPPTPYFQLFLRTSRHT